MIEFTVALVGFLALLSCLVIGIRLILAYSATMTEARAEAGRRAMMEVGDGTGIVLTDNPAFIRNWEAGPDGKRYTPDDSYSVGNAGGFLDTVVDASATDPQDWDILSEIPGNELSELHASVTPASHFALVKGESDTITVDLNLVPAFRHLIYAADSVDVQTEVWMTWVNGIY